MSSPPVPDATGAQRTRHDRGALVVRGRRLAWGERTYVMGIVNATPDSFSGDGRPDASDAVAHALALAEAGADLLDVGAASSRPGAPAVARAEELRRLLPVVRGIRAATTLPLSVDTFAPEIFARAHDAGADMLNSIWGLDDALLALAVERDVPVVVMHNAREAHYPRGVVDDVLANLEAQGARALRAGLPAERVMLDPGIGFAKTPDDNLALLGALDRLVALGFPTLLGTSRKSTIGRLTGRAAADRAFGTAATVALAAAAGIDVVRVHDVAAMRDVVRVCDAVARGWRPGGWDAT